MKIDILSDLHIDFYFRKKPAEDQIRTLYEGILGNHNGYSTGDMLIVAGDIGHYNKQNIQALKRIKDVFGYKHILCVLGNHDYYLIDHASRANYGQNSLERVQRMRELINKEKGMYCLDGNIVEINGVKFGGCDSWYDGEYIRRHFWKKDEEYMKGYVSLLWRRSMADADYIYGMEWQAYAEHQKQKLESIYQKADVMITHINPSIEKVHTNEKYRNEDTTGYFTFDGSHFLKEGSMQYWIFGHTHDRMEYEAHGVKCLCNPMGYPNESLNGQSIQPMQIEI